MEKGGINGLQRKVNIPGVKVEETGANEGSDGRGEMLGRTELPLAVIIAFSISLAKREIMRTILMVSTLPRFLELK